MAEDDITFETFDIQTISKNELRDEIISAYLSAKESARSMGLSMVTDFTVGSEALHLADVIATFLLEHRQDVDGNYRMSMIHTCVGEFLDNEGDMRGVHRIGASPSTGSVKFTRLNPDDTTKAITINSDTTRVTTKDAISFTLLSSAVIEAGNVESNYVECICELEGEYTNVDPNTITGVLGAVSDEVSVTNTSKFDGGCDIEDDDTYRNRILEAPSNVPVGTLAWYENVALDIEEVLNIETENNMSDLTPIPVLHDVVVEKGESGASDVIITFNPMPEFTNQQAKSYLETHFNRPEWDVVGVSVDFVPATSQVILNGTANVNEYLFAILTKAGYALTDLKESIAKKIIEFNDDAYINSEFNPANLCILLEDVTGVASARIVEHDLVNDSYTEVAEPITVEDGKVYDIYQANESDKTSLKNRIQPLAFNIDLELVEGDS